VLLRVDFNVPLKDGEVTDDARIRGALPTIQYLIEQGAKIIACSHLGRPKGVDESLRLRPVAEQLSQLLGKPVKTVNDCVGSEVESAVASLQPGDVLLLENLRFHAEEEANDPEFAKALASLADVYVNDAFGAAHRAHASTAGVAAYLPGVAGLLMEKELNFLGKALAEPERPFAAVIGGAKISDKIDFLSNILKKVDKLMIGGGMANTFLKAEGSEIGHSLVEDEQLDTARSVIDRARERGVQLLLPADVIAAEKVAADARFITTAVNAVPEHSAIVDIGPMTISVFARSLDNCHTVLWNGPMGVFEMPPFAVGSYAVARSIASLDDATTILGGGETGAVAVALGLEDHYSHVSTGGGASLEFLEGKELPGVAALLDKE
jgi:phosphoglycerate kinase